MLDCADLRSSGGIQATGLYKGAQLAADRGHSHADSRTTTVTAQSCQIHALRSQRSVTDSCQRCNAPSAGDVSSRANGICREADGGASEQRWRSRRRRRRSD